TVPLPEKSWYDSSFMRWSPSTRLGAWLMDERGEKSDAFRVGLSGWRGWLPPVSGILPGFTSFDMGTASLHGCETRRFPCFLIINPFTQSGQLPVLPRSRL